MKKSIYYESQQGDEQPNVVTRAALHPSQYIQQYSQHIPTIDPSVIKKKEEALLEHHFTKLDTYHQFHRDILKISEDSVLYEVQFGYFKTNMSVYIGKISIDTDTRQEIGRGNFSRVFAFKNEDDILVIKSVNNPDRNIQISKRILKEVFAIKFASALQVGPEFHATFGYDIIKLNNRFEFIMEICEQIKNQFSSQNAFRQDIINNVALLHQFQMIHCDIKCDNIGWSKTKQKYVILDYGFAGFISEQKGSKTLTNFRGTQEYCSEEMQKTYFLKEPLYVDLYYNDLVGCLKSRNTMFKIQQPWQPTYQKEKHFVRDNDLSRFFRLCFHIFCEDKEKAKDLIFAESKLVMSFKKVVFIKVLDEKTLNQYIKCLEQKCSKIHGKRSYDQILDLENLDSQLYCQLSRSHNLLHDTDANNDNIEVLFAMNKLRNVWGLEEWTEQIFEYLFTNFQMNTNRRRMAAFIGKQIQGSEKKDQPQLLLDALKAFENYFIENKKVRQLLEINNIYWITGNVSKYHVLKSKVWQLSAELDNEILCLNVLNVNLLEFIAYKMYDQFWFIYVDPTKYTHHSKVCFLCAKFLVTLSNIPHDQYSELCHLIGEIADSTKLSEGLNLCSNIQEKLQMLNNCKWGQQIFLEVQLWRAKLLRNRNIFLNSEMIAHFKMLIHNHHIFLIGLSIFGSIQSNYPESSPFNQFFHKKRFKKLEFSSLKRQLMKNPLYMETKSIWFFNIYLADHKFESAQEIISIAMSSNKEYILEFFQFFICNFFRTIISTLPKSVGSFELFLSFMDKIDVEDEVLKIHHPLRRVNRLAVKICQLLRFTQQWSDNTIQMMSKQSYWKFVCRMIDFIAKCVAAVNKIDGGQLCRAGIDYMRTINDIIERCLAQQKFPPINQYSIKIAKLIQKFQESQQINSWGFIYEIIKMLKIYCGYKSSPELQHTIFTYYRTIDSSSKRQILRQYPSVQNIVMQFYFEQNDFQKLLAYFLALNRQISISTTYANVCYFKSLFTFEEIMKFVKTKLIFEPLLMVDRRFPVLSLIYIIFSRHHQSISQNHKQRMIKMMSQGVERNNITVGLKRIIKYDILKHQRMIKQPYPERTQFINFKQQIILDNQFTYSKYRKIIREKGNQTGMKKQRVAWNALISKLKAHEKVVMLIEERQNEKKLQEVLKKGFHTDQPIQD